MTAVVIALYLVCAGISYALGWLAAGAVIRFSQLIRKPAGQPAQRIADAGAHQVERDHNGR